MTTLSRIIAAATLISATAFSPGPAAADDRHEGRDRRDDRYERAERHGQAERYGRDARFAPPRPAPAWAVRDDLRWNGRGWVVAGWGRPELDGRLVQARAVRLELSGLEQERADYYARFAWYPVRLARFDAFYFERRAELERRLQLVTMFAWR
jgi:hypothetical protein